MPLPLHFLATPTTSPFNPNCDLPLHNTAEIEVFLYCSVPKEHKFSGTGAGRIEESQYSSE